MLRSGGKTPCMNDSDVTPQPPTYKKEDGVLPTFWESRPNISARYMYSGLYLWKQDGVRHAV